MACIYVAHLCSSGHLKCFYTKCYIHPFAHTRTEAPMKSARSSGGVSNNLHTLSHYLPFVNCCIFPGLHSSAGFRWTGQESGRAGEWTMFTLGRLAQDSAAAMATVQMEWSASVMRDTMVGHGQHIIFKLIQFFSIYTVQQRCIRWSYVMFGLICR